MDFILKRIPTAAKSRTLLNIAAFFVSTLVTSVFFKNILKIEFPLDKPFTILLLVTLAFVLLISLFAVYKNNFVTPLLVGISLFALYSVLNQIFWRLPFQSYGDIDFLKIKIGGGLTFSRAVLTTTLLGIFYWGVWKFPPLVHLLRHISWVRFISSAISGISSIILIKVYKQRLVVILPMFSAIWFLFMTGYDEYYPFIMAIYLVSLIFLFDYKKGDLGYLYKLVVLYSILPLIYVGFVPLSFVALSYLFILNREIFPRLVSTAAASFFVVLSMAWEQSIPSFFTQLYSDLSFGDKYNQFVSYNGMFRGDTSIYFKSSYAFSFAHFKDLSYLFIYAGGFSGALLLLSALGIITYKKFKRDPINLNLSKGKLFILLFLVMQQIQYFIFMVPKLGPRRDIDLYFTFHIIINFAAALLLEEILKKVKPDSKTYLESLVLCTVLGYQAITFYILGVVGIPKL